MPLWELRVPEGLAEFEPFQHHVLEVVGQKVTSPASFFAEPTGIRWGSRPLPHLWKSLEDLVEADDLLEMNFSIGKKYENSFVFALKKCKNNSFDQILRDCLLRPDKNISITIDNCKSRFFFNSIGSSNISCLCQ